MGLSLGINKKEDIRCNIEYGYFVIRYYFYLDIVFCGEYEIFYIIFIKYVIKDILKKRFIKLLKLLF